MITEKFIEDLNFVEIYSKLLFYFFLRLAQHGRNSYG